MGEIMLEWEEYFEPHILNRGRKYAQKGAVRYISKHEDMIEAVVEGSEYYKVHIRFDGNRIIESFCSCPYAAGGNYCKHMAAVLCEADTAHEAPYVSGDEAIASSDVSGMIPISELISAADRGQLEKILLNLACSDEKTESRIRAELAGISEPRDISSLKIEIDNIFYAYSGRGGFIDYHAAMGFADDLIMYLENESSRLFDDEEYYAAFEMSMYAYVKLGNWDIDDDGEITMISRSCYEIWQKAVLNCSAAEKSTIKEWFIEHSEDGTVVDYMEEMLQDFLRYELASKEELQTEIEYLDKLIDESRASTSCKSVFTCYYGYSVEAIEFRMILMRRLGADEKEIDEFRRKHMNFQSVRKYYIQQAEANGDAEEEIRLLNESKQLDTESSYLIHSYSKRLIELYHAKKEYSLEKAERKADFMSYQGAGTEDFRAYRKMCSREEWNKERTELIRSRVDIDKQCELMAEERMLPELYETIMKQEKRLNLFNKYGFLLAEDYSEPILMEYRRYVSSLAETARNRANYEELIRYLRRMQQYKGGTDIVRELCREWISKYPTRKVMVQELQAILR